MPTYQYRCTDCGSDLEAVQKFTDAALTECPSCGGSLRKVFNAVGVVFKGNGFYRTDSRAGQRNGENGSGDKSESTAEKPDSATDKPTKSDKSGSGTKTESGSAGKDSGGAKQPAVAGASSTGKGASGG